MSNSPAGWYPQEDGRQRYWDGERWTEHFAPGATQATQQAGGIPTAAPGVAAPAARPWFKKKRFLIPGGALALIFLFGAIGAATGSGGDTADTSITAADEAEPSADAAVSDPADSTEDDSVETAAPKPSATPTPTPKKTEKPSGPKIGSKVRDGKFQFVVTGMKCGISTVGSEYFNTEAQGQFCRVDMTITNIGDEPQTMFADNQTAFDTKNRKFSADSEASIYDGKSEVLFEEVNPGNTVKGRVYFDVPKDVKLAKVELHDSMFSGGVEVALKK